MLAQRLKVLAQLIPQTDVVVVDVGTDHAQLPIYLVQQLKIKKVYATDLRVQPLKKAQQNIAVQHLSMKIPTLLADGLDFLDQIPEPKIDYCLFAGLGTTTILEILTKDNDRIANYLICANTEIKGLRKWANQKHYTISQEKFLVENKRHYWLIAIQKSGIWQKCLTEEFGDFKWHEKNLAYQKYLQDQLIYQIQISQQVTDVRIKKQFQEKNDRLQEYLKQWN